MSYDSTTKHYYECPHCHASQTRSYKPMSVMTCTMCAQSFAADENWRSSSWHYEPQDEKEGRTYWVGGVQLHKGMSFISKIEAICRRFTPQMIEHGQGYAVIEYEFAHQAIRTSRHIKTYTDHFERWSISTNGKRVAVIDRNWTPKLTQGDKDDDKQGNYAG